ncbi:hypothetical protein CAFE_01320 [Caprobacter fermentans]|uniref:DUF4386 domain-containing protein n=1 Tax=Caproicibacter fermentans TaxID=2576756 RepID=A0A6N8HUM5_9FIRM|nr:DUF4386 family protein [Caproicibacter fermentans]MVB09476.1 hypothetical protein [Caproicibacter fermentans]
MITLSAAIFSMISSLLICGSIIGLVFTFGYPKILRQEPLVIIEKLYQKRKSVPFLYYLFGLGGFFLVFASILVGKVEGLKGELIFSECGKMCGIVYGVLLYAGITRYTKLFPEISKMRFEHSITDKNAETLFHTFNTYIGETVTEHIAFVFLSAMIFCISMSAIISGCVVNWIGYSGIIIAVGLSIGNLEFLGLKRLFVINRIFSSLGGIWLFIFGAGLLL